MRLLVEAANRSVGVADGRIVPPTGRFDITIRILDGQVRPGLINGHDHLHRNHYGRLGYPPYPNAYAWGRDIHARDATAIERGRSRPRREVLLVGAWKNLRAGVTTVVHHDPWEPDFDDGFPLRVARLRTADSLGNDPAMGTNGAGPFAIHLAEGTDGDAADEVRELARRRLVTRDLLAVHVVGADQDGVQRLRESGAAVVWCPTSNYYLFGRTAPAALLAPGIDVLLGSDSLLTADGDLLDELRAARGLGLLSDDRLLDAVGPLVAQRLGLPVPSLEAGSPADLVVLRRPLLEAHAADVALVVADGVLRVLDPEYLPMLGEFASQGTVDVSGGIGRWVNEREAREVVRGEVRVAPPVVSVIIPTHNREALLREAVTSVVTQTYTDWELLVADDGSTDGTRAYVEGINDPRIRPLFLEHTGTPTRPMMAATAAARGDWLAFLDSDDRWLPDKLRRQLDELAQHPDCRWSYTGYRHVDEGGAPVPPNPPVAFVPHSGWILERLLAFEASSSIVTWLVRRSLFEETGGFDASPGIDLRSDYDLVLRLAARSPVHAVAEPLTLVRVHGSRTTVGRPVTELLDANERVFRKAMTAAPNARIRALCARQCASQLAQRARALSLEGEHRAAFAMLGKAVTIAPLASQVWRSAARCMVQAVVRG
jgi:GT2 family glycosyltransferase